MTKDDGKSNGKGNGEGKAQPKGKQGARKKKYTPLPAKTYWHLYSLQSLESSKLAHVVNKILRDEYRLIK